MINTFMHLMRLELRRFLVLLRFMTRLPMPRWVGYQSGDMAHTARYLPLVGAVVGGIGAVVTVMASMVLPAMLAVVLGIIATVLVTGALHEDGWADTCDGFGATEKQDILRHTKDSHLGAYGVIGTNLLLLTKVSALTAFTYKPLWLALAIITGHTLSRAGLMFMMRRLPRLHGDDTKSDFSLFTINRWDIGIAVAWLALLLMPFFWWFQWIALVAIGLLMFCIILMCRYCQKRLGGITGDHLGATQQLSECFFYVGCCVAFV